MSEINKEKNFISIVAYVKNAQGHIQNFMRQVDALLDNRFEAYEFVFVNDCSIDNTKEKIKEIADDLNGNVIVVDMAWEHKIETAMLAGVDIAIGDFVYEFDTTCIDYDIEMIWKTYKKAMAGYDIVSVSPNKKLKMTSKLFYSYLNKVSFRKLELTTETFRLISRRALNRVLKTREKLRYRKALYQYSGFEQTQVYYDLLSDSVRGKDETLSMSDKFSLASNVLVNFSNVGLRLSLSLSGMFFCFSLFMIVYTVYSFLTINEIAEGWTTTMLFMSISFSGLFFVLGLLSKYMTTILVELKESPTYIYKSVDRLSRK